MIVLSIHAPIEDETDDMKDSFYDKLECVFDKFHMKILLDFNAKVGREDIFKPTIWNESLKKLVMIMELSNKLCHLQKSDCQKYVQCSYIVTLVNLFRYLWMGRHQIDHILIDRRWHSSVPDVQLFRGAD
jgi:hypothetical protein